MSDSHFSMSFRFELSASGLAEKGSCRRLESQLSVFQFLSGSVLVRFSPSELIADSGPVFWPGTHPSFVEVEVPQISKMKQ